MIPVLPAVIAGYIKDLLWRQILPSARELVARLDRDVGFLAVRWDLVPVLRELIVDKDLTIAQRQYLQALMEHDDLEAALRREDPPDRETISTIDTLLQTSGRYRRSNGFQEVIQFMARFKDYAPYNNMLVHLQNPACRFYATEKDWCERFHRIIKEDARPMLILAPKHPVILVYDLDQTCGGELPKELREFAQFEGEWNPRWLRRLVENARRHRIRVDFKPLSSILAGFATISRRQDEKMRIAIHSESGEAAQFGVLCHEMAHILLGHLGCDKDFWWPARSHLDKRVVEIEAEATAYVVTRHLGLEGTSAAYISRYLGDDAQAPEGVSLDMIAKVAGKIERMALRTEPAPRIKAEWAQ